MGKYVCIDNSNHWWKHMREDDPKLLEVNKVYQVDNMISDSVGGKFCVLDIGNYLLSRFISLDLYRLQKIEILIDENKLPL